MGTDLDMLLPWMVIKLLSAPYSARQKLEQHGFSRHVILSVGHHQEQPSISNPYLPSFKYIKVIE